MKKLLTLLAILAVLIPEMKAQENVAKLGILGLPYGRINLNYERVLDEKMTIAVQAGFQVPRTFGNIGNNAEFDDDFVIQQGKWKAFGVTPQLRIYPKNADGAPRGFYFGPYVSHNRNNFNFDVEYDDQNSGEQDIPAEMDVQIVGTGVGFQIGTQWLINDKVSIDWNFFGIGMSYQAYRLDYTSEDPNVDYEEIKADIEAELDDVAYFGSKFKIETTDNSVIGKVKRLGPMFRTSFSIGYAF